MSLPEIETGVYVIRSVTKEGNILTIDGSETPSPGKSFPVVVKGLLTPDIPFNWLVTKTPPLIDPPIYTLTYSKTNLYLTLPLTLPDPGPQLEAAPPVLDGPDPNQKWSIKPIPFEGAIAPHYHIIQGELLATVDPRPALEGVPVRGESLRPEDLEQHWTFTLVLDD